MRRAAKKDANHNPIADYLQCKGWSVLDTSRIGDGKPDMFVGRPGFAAAVEVKDEPTIEAALKALTPKERAFREKWDGPYILAINPEQAHMELLIEYAMGHFYRTRGT